MDFYMDSDTDSDIKPKWTPTRTPTLSRHPGNLTQTEPERLFPENEDDKEEESAAGEPRLI